LERSKLPASSVQVTVSSDHLLGTRRASTDYGGYFYIRGLPPGKYTVQITSIGVRPITIEQVEVELGATTALPPVSLELQPVQLEPLIVLADRESFDPTHTDVGGTLGAEDYAVLPGERDYKAIIAVLPHITESHRGDPLNVAGSTGLENMYFVDGVNVTAPLTAESGTRLPYNFVRAIEVKTGGYEAEYGRAIGAVVNAVTYSGTNDFEANVFGFTSHSALAATPKAQPTLRQEKALEYDVGTRIGGPLVRDRLWYSAAYNPHISRVEREIQGHGVFTDQRTAHVFAGKLTWQATAGAQFEFSLFGDPTIHDAVNVPIVAPAGYTLLNPDPYLMRLETGGVVGSLRSSVSIGNRVLLEASLARSDGRENELGGTESARREPFLLDNVSRTVAGGAFLTSRADFTRSAAVLRGSVTLGSHTLAAGGEYEDVAVSRDFGHPGGYSIERVDSASFVTTFEQSRGNFHNRVATGYLQDSWRATDQLTVNAGVRWSSQTLSGASVSVAQRFGGEWQPRVGVVWDPGAAGTQRVFGSYGRFYQQVPLTLSTFWYADIPFVLSFFSTDPRAPGVTPDSVLDLSTFEVDWARSIPGLEVEHFDEFTVGYERLVGSSSKLTARLIRRDLRSSFQWGLDEANERWVLGTPGEGDFAFLPRPKREYSALELSVNGAWKEVTYRGSYVLSRNWGNYPGLYDSDLGVTTPGGTRGFIAPHQAVNSTGLLPNDRTHVFKLSASHRTKFGLLAGTTFTWASGTPRTVFAPGPGIPVFRAFVKARGSAGRTPGLWDLNIRLGYDLNVLRGAQSRVLLDVLHIGNPQKAVQLEELQYLKNTNGVFSDENPSYGMPIAYQPPMMARLGAEVTF
jgi:hypothetical protein